MINVRRAGALLAPHPDTGFTDLQLASLTLYHRLLKTVPESGVKVSYTAILFRQLLTIHQRASA